MSSPYVRRMQGTSSPLPCNACVALRRSEIVEEESARALVVGVRHGPPCGEHLIVLGLCDDCRVELATALAGAA